MWDEKRCNSSDVVCGGLISRSWKAKEKKGGAGAVGP